MCSWRTRQVRLRWDTEHRLTLDCMCCGSGDGCDRTPGSECTFVERVVLRVRSRVGRILIAVGRRVATFAVVVVSNQFVGKCVCFC